MTANFAWTETEVNTLTNMVSNLEPWEDICAALPRRSPPAIQNKMLLLKRDGCAIMRKNRKQYFAKSLARLDKRLNDDEVALKQEGLLARRIAPITTNYAGRKCVDCGSPTVGLRCEDCVTLGVLA